MTHTLSAPAAFSAREAGGLPGHEVRCSCGHVARTTVGASAALADAQAHVAYMTRTPVQRRRAARRNPWER